MDDIYRAAGIMNPRMGYSINKVVEMISSEHIRALLTEAKRAAVLMALDAAGVSMEEVLRDATLRQDALDQYENDQRKYFEEYWERKIESNAQIQAELDRVSAQYQERIDRNLEEVTQEKAAFTRWQRQKEQEAERMTEAVGLCAKTAAAEATGGAVLALREVGSIVKS
jgi:flagellar biosynthesis GTPase FlhF